MAVRRAEIIVNPRYHFRAWDLQCVRPMENPKTTRREFCAHAISIVTVASLLEGCGGGGSGNPGGPGGGSNVPALSQINGTAAGNTVTVNVDGASALSSVGSAALVQAGNNSILVTRTAQDSFNAFTAICTHEQCVITGFSSGTFVCPCHGSQYTTGGAVQQGPATQRLRQFTTQFTNNVLTITV
jgi:Rieske Fe-S protein